MSIRIRQTEPYYVLPTQRYDLTTRPPSKSMQSNFTFFCKFKVEDKVDTDKPCSIMMRPGLHTGLCYVQGLVRTLDGHWSQSQELFINWEFWYGKRNDPDNVSEFGHIAVSLKDNLPESSLTDTFIAIVRHNSEDKTFTLKLTNCDTDESYIEYITYEGVLLNYENTPYNFGCANYFKQVGDDHYFWGDYSLSYAGLLESIKNTDDEILNFIDNNKNSFDELVNPMELDELVFYFNMLNQNRYKIWDLSDHCNFLMKNMDVGK